MSVLLAPALRDDALPAEVLAHLDEQLLSARCLLALVLEQGSAIRSRDVQAVVRTAGLLRGEMDRRTLLEEQRGLLLARCGEKLGAPPETVTLSALQTLMDPFQAELAGARSAELRGLLAELQREHTTNRALMQVELGFLDHLMGLLSMDVVEGYDTRGSSTSIARPHAGGPHRVLDLHA